MIDIAFQYNYVKKEWVQCTDSDLIKKEIEDIPCVILVRYTGQPMVYFHEMQTDYVFCPKHVALEEIESISDNVVISRNGCRNEGLIGKAVLNLRASEIHDVAFVPFRWRIFQRTPSSPINIAGDVTKGKYCRNGIIRKWYNFAFSVDLIKHKILITKITNEMYNSGYWTDTDVEIPDIVVNAAIDAMRESIYFASGIKPSVLCQLKGRGKEKVKAFIERPYDINIVFLKRFLEDYIYDDNYKCVFDEKFPYEQKDNYKKICEYLEIKPPKSIRKAYSFNPYAIVWYMIFKQWEIKDINYIHKFLYLDECIANLYLHKFYFNKIDKCVTREGGDALENWDALQFYCKWLMDKKGEKKMLAWLYQASLKNNIQNWQWDIMIPFKQYYDALSDEIKDRLLVDGLTEYVHDAISVEITSLSEKWEHERIKYGEEILSYECKINDYEFRLAHNTSVLPRLGAVFNNCVATYRDRVRAKSSIIVYAMNKTGYVACIEIQNERRIVQALGKYNKSLDKETNLFCCYWAKHNNLKIDTDDLCYQFTEKEEEDYDSLIIEQIPYIKYIDEMNLDELLNLDVKRIQEGYYLRLEGMIAENNKHSLSAPYWMTFEDERSRLNYINPQGTRIYEAAFNGNTEAMRALGFMYYYGHGMQRDYGKSLEWFNKAVDFGSSEAADEIKRLKILVRQRIEGRDRIIMEALYNLRKRMAASSVG